MTLIYFLDITGTFIFAISGALAASEKRLDAFGVAFIAFITAVGGGTTRDLLLNLHPLAWIKDNNYLFAIFSALVVAFFFQKQIMPLRKTFFMFDTIGIGLFTIMGLKKALVLGQVSPVVAVLLGMVSATFGGVLRDVFCNEIPLIFRKEIYATACLVGAISFLTFQKFFPNQEINMILAISMVIIIRIFAVKYHLSLPWKN